MNENYLSKIHDLLIFIYGRGKGDDTFIALEKSLKSPPLQGEKKARRRAPLSEKDVCLIAYGDMLAASETGTGGSSETGLGRLEKFLRLYDRGYFSFLHLLPFHPYSSDDGFSVIDYAAVDPRFGNWGDIRALSHKYKLMFDFVLNHGSAQSAWFRSFLKNEASRRGWYIEKPSDYDPSGVFRPRTSPLLTAFPRDDGSSAHIWTTFGPDQVDYNFAEPGVFLEFLRIFLGYVQRGAKIVRLDAIAYLWKEDGTNCIHHAKTHAFVKLLRAIIDYLELEVFILTETNVPHRENISYFGESDEAHIVYNFALPPLVLHAAVSEEAGILRDWAQSLPRSGEKSLFLNFLASHDGVGLLPAKGLIDDAALRRTLDIARRRGALLSYKDTGEGPVPYELNCSYLSVVAPPSLGGAETRARAFLRCHAVLCALAGLPAIYFHSWIGSEHWTEGPVLCGYNRAINRERPPVNRVEAALADAGSLRAMVHAGFSKMLAFRAGEPAFAPGSPQLVLPAEDSIFAILRGPDRKGRFALCLHNFSGKAILYKASAPPIPEGFAQGAFGAELLLGPHGTRWIAFGGDKDVAVLEI